MEPVCQLNGEWCGGLAVIQAIHSSLLLLITFLYWFYLSVNIF